MSTSPKQDDTVELRSKRMLQRYEALSTAPGLIVWVLDANLRPVAENAIWQQYTGQLHTDYDHLGWMNVIHPADRPALEERVATAIKWREAFTTELRIRRSDGLYRRNIIRAVPVIDDGELVEWIGTATDIEHARQAADDLAAVESRLRTAHAAAGIATWEWYLDRGEVRWSTEVLQLLGLPGDTTPAAQLWMDCIHPEDRARAIERWEVAIAGSATHFTDTFRILLPDGNARWIVSSAVIFRLPSGEAVRAVGLNMDVTAQRLLQNQMEEALAEGHDLGARLIALTDEAEVLLSARDESVTRRGVVALARRVLPADGYAIWWNEADTRTWRVIYAEGLGDAFAAVQLPGDPVESVLPIVKDDVYADPELDYRRAAYDAEGIRSLLTIPLPIRGERRATLVTYHRTPHVTSDTELRVSIALGQVAAAALGNAEFNAAQDRAQRQAQRQATRMAYLADASAVLGTLEFESTLEQVARMAVPAVTDWCAVDLLNEHGQLERLVTAHIDPEKVALAQELQRRYPDDPSVQHGVLNVLRTGVAEFYQRISDEQLAAGAIDAEHLRILRSLGLRSALIAPLAARGRSFGVMTFVASSEDRELSQDDATVLIEVARRAAMAIDNARLYREVETANRLKDEFLAILSHELRTPLNAIMGWTHMLRQGLSPESQAHAFAVISRNAQSQKQLVEDLLDVARIAAGRLDLDRRPFDLCEAARASADSALPAATDKGITLEPNCGTEPVVIDADPHRIQQVVANLLGNAIKFTEPGGHVTLTVRTVSDDEAELIVRDTGVGIERSFLPYMFDRFRQADTSLARPYPGLGLGLWVVKQIVDAHRGRIRVESDGPGKGTTMTVTLPRA